MNFQDCSDSDDSNDMDYKPPGEEENLSEVESDDPIDEEDSSEKTTSRSKAISKKRTKGNKGSQKKTKLRDKKYEVTEEPFEETNPALDKSEEEKKRLDALWEDFQRPAVKKSTSNKPNANEDKSKSKEPVKSSKKPDATKKRDFEEMFENPSSANKIETSSSIDVQQNESEPSTKPSIPVFKKTGGLASVLGQIGKKDKLTVLEKSKKDWDSYKQKEGIVEELVTHNKGKDGYLEKQDFLERTDLRQFELEKAMRSANRSHRN
ncbi:craniofacial development protein 1 [Adelges cooleyi]|uniref:craniofacial development protein 1 n=1 Tax=Adelges cooleyi TaxID=133065 RepID=UPI0021803EB7|nr:craniofacial development protein 1 [Adelges cooleyi]